MVKKALKVWESKVIYQLLHKSQLWRARSLLIQKKQAGDLYTSLAQASRSILHFR